MIYLIGDIHGYYEKLLHLLKQHQLVDDALNWCAGDATLCFLGDYFDRGPDGIATIDLIRRLQQQAPDSGGEVVALLGNHEVFFLSAYRFHQRRRFGKLFLDDWYAVGGQYRDLKQATDDHAAWITALPAMRQIGNLLVMHADSLFYTLYGGTIAEVNEHIRDVLESDILTRWDQLIGHFVRRRAFMGHNAQVCAEDLLHLYGGKVIVHGHTPIPYMTMQDAKAITAPLIYNHDLCINLDGGLYLGGPGFVYKVP